MHPNNAFMKKKVYLKIWYHSQIRHLHFASIFNTPWRRRLQEMFFVATDRGALREMSTRAPNLEPFS